MKAIEPRRTRGTMPAALATVAVGIAIPFLLLAPGVQPGMMSDKLAHLLAFAALAAPLSTVRARFAPFIFLAVCAYGGGIELLQPLVGRSGGWADFGADVIGALIGAAGGAALGRSWRT